MELTLRHDFIGAAQDSSRHSFNRNCREPYSRNQGVSFLCVYMSTSGCIHGELLCILYLIIDQHNRRSTTSPIWTKTPEPPGRKEEFGHYRGVSFGQHRSTLPPLRRGVPQLAACCTPAGPAGLLDHQALSAHA